MARRGDLEHGVALRNRTTKVHPLPVDILNTYPVQSYDPSVVKNGSCAICLDDFTPDKTNIRVLPCGHGFCTGCIGRTRHIIYKLVYCRFYVINTLFYVDLNRPLVD